MATSSWITAIQRLRAAMLARLQEELRADARVIGQGDITDCVDAAVRSLCLEARRDGLRAEAMIIRLKRDWHALPSRERGPSHSELEALSRAVSLCIKRYYRDE